MSNPKRGIGLCFGGDLIDSIYVLIIVLLKWSPSWDFNAFGLVSGCFTLWGLDRGYSQAFGPPVAPVEWLPNGNCMRWNRPGSFPSTRPVALQYHLRSSKRTDWWIFQKQMTQRSHMEFKALPIATWAESTAWFIVRAQMWRLCTVLTPFTRSRCSLTSL